MFPKHAGHNGLRCCKWTFLAMHSFGTSLKRVFAGILFVLAPFSPQSSAQGADPVPGIVVIAMSNNYAPFTLLDANGEPAGMFVDIWRLWAEKTGQAIEFKASSWADSLTALRNGEADIHSGLFLNSERAEWMDFSRPVYQIKSSFYYRNGEEPPADLTNTSIGTVLDSFQEAFLREKNPEANIVTFTDDEAVMLAVSRNEIDAGLGENPAIETLMDRLGLRGGISRSAQALLHNDLFFSVRQGEADLLGLIEAGLDAITLDELAAIENRWMPRSESLQFVDRPVLLSAQERAWLADHPVLRVHNEMDWEPFNFNVDGRAQGFSIDYMNLLAGKLGIEADYVSGPTWDQFLGLLRAGDLDVMLNIVKTPSRDEYIIFTDPYVENLPVLVVRNDNQDIHGFEDLFGRSLAIPEGFFYQEIIEREFPQIELVLLDSQLESLSAVSVGLAEATIGGVAVQDHLIQKHLLTNLRIVSGLPGGIFVNNLRIGVRSDQGILHGILQKAVESVDPLKIHPVAG